VPAARHCSRLSGFRYFLNPSLGRLNLGTVSAMMMPGKTAGHGATAI
jgi:hypothetical protein